MSESIRIAIPTNGPGGIDSERSAHFGHADSFTIIEVADGHIVGDEAIVNPPHSQGGCGMTVTLLANAGVGSAIVVGMGGGPLSAMSRTGMKALFDDQSPTPRAAVEAFLAGKLSEFGGDHICAGH